MSYHKVIIEDGRVNLTLDTDPLDPANLSLTLDAGLMIRARLNEDSAVRLAQALNNFYFSKYFDEMDAQIATDEDTAVDITAITNQPGDPKSWPI